MTHDEFLNKVRRNAKALRAVVELHQIDFGTPGEDIICDYCKVNYPCPTIQAIRKELS